MPRKKKNSDAQKETNNRRTQTMSLNIQNPEQLNTPGTESLTDDENYKTGRDKDHVPVSVPSSNPDQIKTTQKTGNHFFNRQSSQQGFTRSATLQGTRTDDDRYENDTHERSPPFDRAAQQSHYDPNQPSASEERNYDYYCDYRLRDCNSEDEDQVGRDHFDRVCITRDYDNIPTPTHLTKRANATMSSTPTFTPTDRKIYRRDYNVSHLSENDDQNESRVQSWKFGFLITIVCLFGLVYLNPITKLSSETVPSLQEMKKDYPIHNQAECFRILNGNLRLYWNPYLTKPLVMTLVGFQPHNADVKLFEDKFDKFKIDVARVFLNVSHKAALTPLVVHDRMGSVELERLIENRKRQHPGLVFLDDINLVSEHSALYLRGITDEYDPTNTEKFLALLSFQVPYEFFNTSDETNLEVVAKEFLRSSFRKKVTSEELEPFLARVSNNLIVFKLINN